MAYWKNIIGFPEYEIDTLGRVWSWHNLRFLKGQLTGEFDRGIYLLWWSGLNTQKEIAKLYNTDQSVVSRIVNKKRWKHIWSR